MTRPLDRDLRALLYSEEEAHRRVRNRLWLGFLLPVIAAATLVAGLAALAAAAHAGGFPALAGAAVVYLAVIGLITGWVVIVASLTAAGLLQDASATLLFWTARARSLSIIFFFRARSLSDSLTHLLMRAGEWTAMIKTGFHGLAEMGDSIRAVWTRKRHG
jgi:hypothetical protein